MAYDLKKLGEKIAKEAGLSIAEEALEKLGKGAYVGLKGWLQESAVESDTKIDDLVMPFVDKLDPIVLPLIEKLDLDKDGK